MVSVESDEEDEEQVIQKKISHDEVLTHIDRVIKCNSLHQDAV